MNPMMMGGMGGGMMVSGPAAVVVGGGGFLDWMGPRQKVLTGKETSEMSGLLSVGVQWSLSVWEMQS